MHSGIAPNNNQCILLSISSFCSRFSHNLSMHIPHLYPAQFVLNWICTLRKCRKATKWKWTARTGLGHETCLAALLFSSITMTATRTLPNSWTRLGQRSTWDRGYSGKGEGGGSAAAWILYDKWTSRLEAYLSKCCLLPTWRMSNVSLLSTQLGRSRGHTHTSREIAELISFC